MEGFHSVPRDPDNLENIQRICKRYMNYHVIAQMRDGTQRDGILEGMDDQGVIMLVPEDVDSDDDRQFFGYGPGFRPRFRRFRRFRFPFSLFVFPFFTPYPYYY
ncbi:hypothetical protein EWH99_05465 [Sporolactobacillus sp. THM7-7]|nr:hypothetical protein EWH99_05465 [Sporolactobacillus sp. THM7-7]